jgi:hypothetical protein
MPDGGPAFIRSRKQQASSLSKRPQVASRVTSLKWLSALANGSVQSSVTPARANKIMAGTDHSGTPTSLIAAMNNSPHTDMIVRISKWIKDFSGSDVMGKSPR